MSYDGLTEPTHNKQAAEGTRKASSGTNGPSPMLIALVILAALALTFILQNRDEVRTHFLFFTKTSKVWATIGIALIIGAGLDRLFSLWWRRRKGDNSPNPSRKQ